ncbi:MAG TPA: hypothetical protein VFU69_11110 [Ktedonobacterales bacterium]|nr:hypothetical protein [Ktedonobacterales bacterium]
MRRRCGVVCAEQTLEVHAMPFDPYAYDLANPAQPSSSPSGRAAAAPRALPAEAQYILWQGLRAAATDALDLWDNTPPGSKRQPPAFPVRHAGKPSFHPAALRQQTLAGLHRLLGIEIRLAAQALEALILTGEAAAYRARLAEQCGRVGQLYSELARRAGVGAALAVLRWELGLLRYRASPVLSRLLAN